MLLKEIPRRVWLYCLLIVIGLSAAFFIILGWGARTTALNQVLARKQTIARAEASNLTSFFQIFGNSVASLGRSNSMDARGITTSEDLDAFVEQWKGSGLIGGIILIDKNGIVKFNSNILGNPDTGADLSDRDYFIWAKNQTSEGKYFVGKAVVSRVGASKGKVVVVVASPTFTNGVFSGALGASVILEPLTERYLKLIKISDTTSVYLIGKDGDLLHNVGNPALIGSNIFGLENQPFLNSEELTETLKKALSGGEEGTLQVDGHLIAYSPVSLGDRNWMIITDDPIQKVNEMTMPIFIKQLSVLILVGLSIVLFGLIVAREVRGPRSE